MNSDLSAEESSGSDPSGVALSATVQDDCYVLSGKKTLVTNAQNSQVNKKGKLYIFLHLLLQLLTVVAKTEDSEK